MTGPTRGSRLLAATIALLLIAAGCSGGDDEATPGEGDGGATSSTAVDAGSAETDTDTEPAADPPSSAEIAGLFDIDGVLAADPDCPSPVTGDPLFIGYAADMSDFGSFADGPASQVAAHLANLINCTGGLAGRPVSTGMVDISGPDPLVSRDGTNSLLDQGASVLLGPPFPDPAFRVLQATGGQVPVIFPGSTEPALANDASLSFLVAFNDTQGATAAAQFAQSQGWATAVTFSAPGPYFGYNPQVFTAAFTAIGGEVVADYPMIPQETVDFADPIAEMAADPPDVIYSGMLANQLVALRQQLAEAGLGQVQVLGTDAFEATNGYSLAPGNEGIYHVTHTDPRPDTRLQRLLSSFAAANGGVPPSSPSMAALAGDAVAVIADAYLRTETTDPVALGQAIATAQGVEGITGVLSYERSGAPSKPMYVHQVVDGQPTLAGIIGG